MASDRGRRGHAGRRSPGGRCSRLGRVYRVGTMNRLLISTVAAVCLAVARNATAQGWNLPTDAQRCPSKWGAGDTRGSANHVKPASVLAAMQLAKTGQIVELSRGLEGRGPGC